MFADAFDEPAGVGPAQWHAMFPADGAVQNGQGQLDVAQLGQIRTTAGWTLPVGTQVRVTASLLMPDTGSSYAAFWVQHPNGVDPRELDVIESYGPLKPTGAQLGSHICYDDAPDTIGNACVATGAGPSCGRSPRPSRWARCRGRPTGSTAPSSPSAATRRPTRADDGQGDVLYSVASTPDPRRVPGNATPFHLRLSNKLVEPQYAVAGGTRSSMLVDWVTVEVKYP